jgi:hypothetical protein
MAAGTHVSQACLRGDSLKEQLPMLDLCACIQKQPVSEQIVSAWHNFVEEIAV